MVYRPRCVMFMLGTGPTFIDDWAHAVSSFAEVVGLASVRDLPIGERLSRRAVYALVNGLPAFFVRPLRLRPTRLWWRLNAHLEARALCEGMNWIIERFGEVDILHSHFYSGAVAVPRLAQKMRLPFVHTEHSNLLADPEGVIHVSRPGQKIIRSVFTHAEDVIFVSSQSMRNAVRMGITGRFHVVPNPVDSTGFYPRAGDASRDEIRLISIGRLIPLKRIDLLLRAFALAVESQPRLQLEIVGRGAEEWPLRRLAEKLRIADRVLFAGYLDRQEVAVRLRRADIYVHTSQRESFGVALVEALFSGLPVVAVRAGGVTDILPLNMGLIVDRPEAAEVAEAIQTMVGRLGAWDTHRIADQARRLFGPEPITERLREIYFRALKGAEWTI